MKTDSIRRVFLDYHDLAKDEDILADIIVPSVIGLIIIITALCSQVTIKTLTQGLNGTLNTIVTALSILAGFNTASLSIIATSNSEIVSLLRRELIEGTNRAKIEQIISYFSWSVIFQLVLLTFSIVISLLYGYLLPIDRLILSQVFSVVTWGVVSIVIIGAIYSLKLTIRNILILHMFLIADSRR